MNINFRLTLKPIARSCSMKESFLGQGSGGLSQWFQIWVPARWHTNLSVGAISAGRACHSALGTLTTWLLHSSHWSSRRGTSNPRILKPGILPANSWIGQPCFRESFRSWQKHKISLVSEQHKIPASGLECLRVVLQASGQDQLDMWKGNALCYRCLGPFVVD